MILGLMIVLFILSFVFLILACTDTWHDTVHLTISGVLLVLGVIVIIFGSFHGFINYPATEGTHQGVVTAVDLEGIYFRRYEVYLKSSGYTNQSDETKYLIYENEDELAEQLKNAIGKTVKINYGHDGGYIGWNSCGTYHIKSIETVEE